MSSIQLISLINQQNNRLLTPSQTGQVVDFLYSLDYFHTTSQTFGRQYLVMLVELKMIETYVLRKNKPLIDIKHCYVLVDGKLDKNGYGTGAQINIQRDGHVNTIVDSVFIRLPLANKSKLFKKIRQYEHQKLQRQSIIQTRLIHDDQKQILISKLKQIQIFSQLPRADFNQLAYGCTYRNFLKGKISHEFGKKVSELIYIIDGQIKLTLPFQVQADNLNIDSYLQKYLVKQSKKTQKHQITANYSKGDWIGIQQYFQNIPFKSLGIIMSVQAKVLYIPVNCFSYFFNSRTNHAAFMKIKYLRQIKADLLQKSSKAQQKKQNQKLRWSQQKASMSPQLRRKISKYQLQQTQQQIKNPQTQTNSYVPTKVVHMIKSQSQVKEQTQQGNKINENNKINQLNNYYLIQEQRYRINQVQRINLFPQQYQKQFIHPSQKRQIQDAQSKKNTNMMMYLSPKYHRKACHNNKSKSNIKQFSNLQRQNSFEKYFFSMTRKVTENYALASTFYRNYLNKGDQLGNINFKTINSLQPSRKDLLLKRRNQLHQLQTNNKSNTSFILPGLRTRPTLKQFQPMSPHKGSSLDLSQHLMKQKYHIESNNSFKLRQKQSYQTIYMRNYSNKITDLKEYNKTLFVNRQRLDYQQKKFEKSNEKRYMKDQMRRKTSLLSIE